MNENTQKFLFSEKILYIIGSSTIAEKKSMFAVFLIARTDSPSDGQGVQIEQKWTP